MPYAPPLYQLTRQVWSYKGQDHPSIEISMLIQPLPEAKRQFDVDAIDLIEATETKKDQDDLTSVFNAIDDLKDFHYFTILAIRLVKKQQNLHLKKLNESYSSEVLVIMDVVKDDLDRNPLDSGELNGTPISVILSQAAKIKSAQQASLRTEFEKLPTFLKNTLFSGDELTKIRQQRFGDRLDEANRLKQQGNIYYQAGKFYEAKALYENAISIFRFLTNINPSWREVGIRDEDIRKEEIVGENEDQSTEIKHFLVKCYNNLALTCIHITPCLTQDAIQACSAAIDIDPQHAKSFYLRGKSRLSNRSQGKTEERLALYDLQKAKYLDPSNKSIALLYSKIQMDLLAAKQRERKTFQGMFDKGMTLGYERNETKAPNADKLPNDPFRSDRTDRMQKSRFAITFIAVLVSRFLLGKVFPMTVSRVDSVPDKF